MTAQPRVVVIVPTRVPARRPALEACVRALDATRLVLAVVVVGDGVAPPRPPGSLAVTRPDRGGYAAAVNTGLATATADGRRPEYILLLNDDAAPRPHAIQRLVAAADAAPEVDLFCPKVLMRDGRVWSAGGDYSLSTGIPTLRGWGRADDARYDVPGPVTFAAGCAVLVRMSAGADLLPLSEDYFLYAEDIDLSLRADRIHYVPDATFVHEVDTGRVHDEPWRLRLMTANLMRVLIRHGGVLDWLTAGPSFALRWIAPRVLGGLARGHWIQAGAVLSGVSDFARSPTQARAVERQVPG